MLVARGMGLSGAAIPSIVTLGMGYQDQETEKGQAKKKGGKSYSRKRSATSIFVRHGMRFIGETNQPQRKSETVITAEAKINTATKSTVACKEKEEPEYCIPKINGIQYTPEFVSDYLERIYALRAYVFVEDFVSVRMKELGNAIRDEAMFLEEETKRIIKSAIDREDEDIISILCVGV